MEIDKQILAASVEALKQAGLQVETPAVSGVGPVSDKALQAGPQASLQDLPSAQLATVEQIKSSTALAGGNPTKILDYTDDLPHEKRLVRLDKHTQQATVAALGQAEYHIVTTSGLQGNWDYGRNDKVRMLELEEELNGDIPAEAEHLEIDAAQIDFDEATGEFVDTTSGKPISDYSSFSINSENGGQSFDLDSRALNPDYNGASHDFSPEEWADDRPLHNLIKIGTQTQSVNIEVMDAKIMVEGYRPGQDKILAFGIFDGEPKAFEQNGRTYLYDRTDLVVFDQALSADQITYQWHQGGRIPVQQGSAEEYVQNCLNQRDEVVSLEGLEKQADKLSLESLNFEQQKMLEQSPAMPPVNRPDRGRY